MRFESPQFLFFLVPLAIFLYLNSRGLTPRKKILYPFAQRPGLKNAGRKFPYQWIKVALQCIGGALLVIALARPQTSTSTSKRSAEGIDIMIAFDVSKSMTIEDYEPYSRLEIARKVIKKFISGRKDDRIGFLMFSGESVTLCPPTLDYEVLEKAVDAANVDQLKDGTAIGDALANSVNRIKDSTAKSRIIILLTDGDSNMGSIAPLTAGSLAQGYGIKVYSIAIGKEGIVPMPQYESFFGQTRKVYTQVESTINPELLMKISQETGGKFFRPTEKDSLSEVFQEINKLEKTKVETKQRIHWNEHFEQILMLGMFLIFLEFILAKTIWRILPN